MGTTNPRNISFPKYGGRGIRLAREWQGRDGYYHHDLEKEGG